MLGPHPGAAHASGLRLVTLRRPVALLEQSQSNFTLCRAFAEFAVTQLPQQLHEAVIAATQAKRLIGHIARDSTAIPARENLAPSTKAAAAKKRAAKKSRIGKSPKRPTKRRKHADHGTRIQRQRQQKLDRMLKDLPLLCDYGVESLRPTRNEDAELYKNNLRQHGGNYFRLPSANHKPRAVGLCRVGSVSCCV